MERAFLIMSLNRYFKPISSTSKLPDPDEPLSQSVPPSSIRDANDTYIQVTSAQSQRPSKRASYVKPTGVQQVQISKYALSHRNKEAIRRFSKQYCVEICKSSVRIWRAKYVAELNRKRAIGNFEASGEIVVQSLPSKKRGRPLLLGCELDDQVKTYIKDLRGKGGNVDTTVVIACAEGIVSRVDKKLLKDNGGPNDLSKTWAKSLLYVKRKATTSAKVGLLILRS